MSVPLASLGRSAGEKIPTRQRQRISTTARRAWLEARDVPLEGLSGDFHDRVVNMLFETGAARDALEQRLRGRRGRFLRGARVGGPPKRPPILPGGKVPAPAPYARQAVRVDDIVYRLAGSVPADARHGAPVGVVGVFPSWSILRYLAGVYAKEGISAQTEVSSDSLSVQVRWIQ